MEAQLSAQPTPAEENDDRYVKIAALVAEHGKSVREEVFRAVEGGNFARVIELAEDIRKLDFSFMLAMQTGMKIRENQRKAQAASAPPTAPVAEVAQTPPARRSFVDKIFRR